MSYLTQPHYASKRITGSQETSCQNIGLLPNAIADSVVLTA